MAQSSNGLGQQVGNYRLDRLLGHGGFADVYLGTHVYLHTQAALKVLHTQLDNEGVEAFRNEALLVAHLVHPHIVRVLDFDVEDHQPFLVMDYAPHGNLRQRHPQGTCLPSATIVSYVKQVASALQYAHDQKVIHRDVKPENMLLSQSNEVLLSDFGIALVAQSSRHQQTEEVVLGTLAYMAPEHICGKARPASDQYSLAAIVYEWLCGERLFPGSYAEIMTQHLTTPPPPLSERGVHIPPAVEQVLQKALSKDYHQRFPRVQDFAQSLELAYQAPPALGPVPSAARPQVSALPPTKKAPPLTAPPLATEKAQASTTRPPIAKTPPAGPSVPVRGRSMSRLLRRGILLLLTVLFLLGAGLCGTGYALFHFFTTRNVPASSNGTPAAIAKGNDFVTAIAHDNYDHAYSDLAPSITNQTSKTQFIQQGQEEDRCYGPVTRENRTENDTTARGNTLSYVYNLTRGKMSKSYQLRITLQQNNVGNWQITDYNSSIQSIQPVCP